MSDVKGACAFKGGEDDSFECMITTYNSCRAGLCVFQATKEQIVEAVENSYTRLRKLTPEYQKAIAGKYYHGKMPWREEDVHD